MAPASFVPLSAPRRRLAVLLATAPGERFQPLPPASDPPSHTLFADDFACVASALRSAVAAGDDAALFLMDHGVLYATDPRLPPLLAEGIDVALCATDAEAQGLDLMAAASHGILLGSQHDHARLVRDSDRFLSFT
ncbi:MAG: hypothetical protein JNJ46_14560 [Myxococcales bacterium]|jgi:hypothetical protein|nr:hypothetical protein [Myxococcales bacterium]